MSVVVEFESGLGNQLFQYAAGYELAKKHKTDLVADSSAYCARPDPSGRVTFRPFILQELGLPMTYRDNPSEKLFNIRGVPRLYRSYINRGLKRYRCPGHHTAEFGKLSADSYLSGYFQDLKYFKKRRPEICEIIGERLEKAAKKKIEPIPYNWGAAHVRLGDYLKHPEFYPDWFAKYTPSVVRSLLEDHRCSKVLIFSDEPDKAAELLKEFEGKVEFAESDFALEGALDLYRMSTATVLAIANSSFSWWAAMLASNTGSRVIAPVYWSEWCKNPQDTPYPSDDVFGEDIEDDSDEE